MESLTAVMVEPVRSIHLIGEDNYFVASSDR